jgi:thymidine kinase
MIEVICGPMFSGKTEELIRRIKRVIISETPYVVFKPNIESRNDKENNAIATHDLCGELQAVVVDNTDDIYNKGREFDVIAIDEAQFFDEGLYKIVLKLADEGKRIIISGLDLDYERNPFPTMSKLFSIADKVDKINSICMFCKKNLANYSKRVVDNKELMFIGDKQTYKPICRKCFNAQN